MVDRPRDGDHAPHSSEDDLGAPVTELKELRIEESEGFLRRLRSRVERRMTAVQIVDFGVPAMGRILIEYLSMILALFPRAGSSTEESNDE